MTAADRSRTASPDGILKLPGREGCCWIARSAATAYPTLDASLHADALVVGAGIVGLTAALRLCQEGRSVIVLEARRVGRQVTGRSTAKITTQHGLIYRHLTDMLGREQARIYAEANAAGLQQIIEWIERYDIDCDLEHRDAYVFVDHGAATEQLASEADAARAVGLVADLLNRAPLPFATGGALRFSDQAQFNPQAYLAGLAAAVTSAGGQIFEQSPAVLIDEAARWRAVTSGGNVHAECIVVATNMTVKSPVGMSKRTQPRMHAVMAFRIAQAAAPAGMFISADAPTHSIRVGRDDVGPLLIVLGPKFNTGQDGDVSRRFVELESWTRAHFAAGDIVWRWCNEDYDTADRVAYVGESDPDKAPGFYIATGFNAWGISNGTAAGLLIADQIVGRRNPWAQLYDPRRPAPDDFNQSGDTQSMVASVDDIRPGGGGVIKAGEEKVAVWRDDAGSLHAMSASCTHKGCTVTWNNADRTWDCPCHGSMFEADGTVIHGPAKKPLKAARLPTPLPC
ncbi:MAG: yhfW1 [Devosia sp.]|uniref:FAD-dependent oxidoreductase n=1 Tax=Devosia sp. TaxID=1871048 RepID=UPI00261720FE|nr:FAD-dependent oxidoreductase [Devosia sp.]MDB5542193.1 yhfW1 [Devosia sp.]